MGLSFSRKAWEKVRPKDAKDSGVGKAMDAVLASEKHVTGPIGAGTKAATMVERCEEALKAIESLLDALKTGESKASDFKDSKAKSAFEDALADWRKELKVFNGTVRERALQACKIVAFYEGDIEAGRIGKEILAVRAGVSKVDEVVKKAGSTAPASIKAFQSVSSAKTLVLTKVAGKHTKEGMKKYLSKVLAGHISRGFISASDLPDTDGRELLEAQVSELTREFDLLAAKFA